MPRCLCSSVAGMLEDICFVEDLVALPVGADIAGFGADVGRVDQPIRQDACNIVISVGIWPDCNVWPIDLMERTT